MTRKRFKQIIAGIKAAFLQVGYDDQEEFSAAIVAAIPDLTAAEFHEVAMRCLGAVAEEDPQEADDILLKSVLKAWEPSGAPS
jgi:hypothetical protein